jgi:hypothetical protein
MQDHSAMSEIGPVNGTIAAHSQARCRYIRESTLLTLVLYSVVRASEALAGDQPSNRDSALKEGALSHRNAQSSAAAMFSLPFVSAKPLSDAEEFSATEFRPRKRGLLDKDSARGAGSIIDAPMLKGTSVWQQLSDYKSQDRVRLLTLWQMRGSSLSLQAGRRGTPSLQWSTPWVRREGASRGLFDRLLAVTPRAGGGGSGGNPRSSVTRPTGIALASKTQDSSSAGSAIK